MKCHYCGTELHGNEIFCRHCGTRQNSTSQPEPVAAAPVLEEAAPVQMPAPPVPQPAPVFEEQTFSWKPYEAAPAIAATAEPLFDFEKAPSLAEAPKIELPTGRGLCKMLFLGILTLGIYPIVIWSRLVTELNIAASRHDGERSMPFFGMVMLAPITLGILPLVWMNKLCRRIGCELQRRKNAYSFGPKDFWLWNFLMSFLCGVCMGVCYYLYFVGTNSYWAMWALLFVGMLTAIGPLVFTARLMKAMNQLNEDFNVNG